MLWLFPLTYAIHLAEEFWGGEGFPVWVARIRGTPLPVDTFLMLNAIGMALVILGVVLARRAGPFAWIPVTLAGIVVINASAHLIGTLVLRSYSPGLVSGLLLWFPLGIYTLRRNRRSISGRNWRIGWIGAIVAHGIVTGLAIVPR